MKFYSIPFLILFLIGFSQSAKSQKAQNPKAEIKSVSTPSMDQDKKEVLLFLQKMNAFNKAFDNKQEQKVIQLKTSLLNDMDREIEQGRLSINQAGMASQQARPELIQKGEDDDYVPATGANETKLEVQGKATAKKQMTGNQEMLKTAVTRTAKLKQIASVFRMTTFKFDAKNELAAKEGRVLLQEFVDIMKMELPDTKAKKTK